MIIQHHDLEIPLEDEWWEKAGMTGFTPFRSAYAIDRSILGERLVCMIAINDIAPVVRAPGVSHLKESLNEGLTAEGRVSRIFRGFLAGAAIPPVEVVRTIRASYTYKLTHGVHRLYCSLAAGFTHVPAVQGFDWETLDHPELENQAPLC